MEVDRMEEGFYFRVADGKDIYTHCWEDVVDPKAIVQIFHGMGEHGARYGRLATFLNRNGFIVYANDHRGHGKTAETLEEIGYIGEDGFNGIVEDEHILTGIIKKKYPGFPVIILGHSFGSFVAQDYITRYGKEIYGAILSGSALNNGLNVMLGWVLTAIQKRFISDRKKAYLINKLGFSKFNSRIEKPKSIYAWLSRDDAEVKKYDADPFCGEILTINFFYFFFKGLIKLYKSEKIRSIPDKLPLYICSGSEDP